MTAWDLDAAQAEVGPSGNPWRLWRYEWAVHVDGWTHGCRKRGTRYTDAAAADAAFMVALAEGRPVVMTQTSTLLRPAYAPKRTTILVRHHAYPYGR
ncbi:hypothetical protein [Lichenibacterium dinghuense]|uniref:hypothetical protein n=1 Tax=Lichenibacterium dinghuense TaxID=2895977 RepID=UPI001F47B19D|nr:hypothetical protein [Lichenibacterium sp. 6Y81]